MSMNDNVAVALEDLPAGKMIKTDRYSFVLKSNIPFGHKFALTNIRKGEYIIKYGEIIGVASKDILQGEHVHVHNVQSLRGRTYAKS